MGTENLTELERKALTDMTRCSFWEWGIDSGLWVDVYIGEFAKDGTVLRGVLSSLKQKGLIYIEEYDRDQNVMGLTLNGKEAMRKLAEEDSELAKRL